MAQTIVIVALSLALAFAAFLHFGVPTLLHTHWGKLALLVGAVVLPVVTSAGSMAVGFHQSSRTVFCLTCHEMQNHGKSLFADNPKSLVAAHYQNRLVDRDSICYSCHKDYAMFGDVKAKLNGLRHVYVHYLGSIPNKFALYQPYPNSNCLHCHADARRFVEGQAHAGVMTKILSNQMSCLGCHNVAHDMKNVEAGNFWQAQYPQ
ncbi:MAG: NapC/NirT family cytochrome c [Deltaproteobacteria bacterium]|nr:NapC/NirT family cytochrome c [Deltaproteobacteria bacterium]